MDESLVSGVWAEPLAFLWLLDFVEYSISLSYQIGNGTLVDTDTNLVGDFKMNDVVADFHDGAVDTTTGDHAITALEILYHLAEISLFLLLRANEQEIEDRKHRNEGDQHIDLPEDSPSTTWRSSRGLCVGPLQHRCLPLSVKP
jgi:hypothetical protein